MISSAERYSFDALHPFSLITDEHGTIQLVGRSLAKILPQIQEGRHFGETFSINQPSAASPRERPQKLLGELVVLTARLNERVKLRGQVVPCSATSTQFLFALELSISSPSDISALNLTITDFRISDPIFDFLLFMQGQILNQERLRQAKSSLEWKNRITRLLLSIALSTEESDDEEAVYRTTLDAVCPAFGWDVGHVLVPSRNDPTTFISSGLWTMHEGDRYTEFYRDTMARSFKEGEGLPGRVVATRDVVWIPNLYQDPNFPRRKTLSGEKPIHGVGVPIFVGDTVVAVLEFFKECGSFDSDAMLRFFELLSAQLSSVVARQRAEIAARRHLAGLANASKMATLGEIAAGVAHEINNPLHTLTLTSHLLKRLSGEGRLTNDILESQLSKVETCAHRMATIVSELKAFSRDSTHDEHKRVPLKALVSETLDLCHARLLSKDISVEVSDIPNTWEAECHPSQISQVMLNLLNNAYDAAMAQQDRWVKLEVRDQGPAFEISVTDSGPGIPRDIARKIMDPFFTTKPPGKGTGLGLSISSNIMTDHGGSLTLDNSSRNTRFVMTLPKTQQHNGRANTNHSSPYPSRNDSPSTLEPSPSFRSDA